MLFPQKVKSALWGIVDAMALNISTFVKNPGKDFTRKRMLGFVQMIRFCICLESGCISHELLKYFFFRPENTPSASALIQQRAKLRPEAFFHLLKQFHFRFPPAGLLKRKYSLIAADGCEFTITRNPHDPSTFHPPSGKSKKGFNTLHTVSLFDLLSKRYLDVVCQPGRLKNEFAAFCQLIDRFPYGGCPIFVTDRGFASYNVFAHLFEKGSYFVIRAKDVNVQRILRAGSLPDCIDQWLELILNRSNARKKRLHPELESLYRYICRTVSFDFITDSRPEYHMKLRIVRFQTAEGVYENLITNLPDDEFQMEEIRHIYSLR